MIISDTYLPFSYLTVFNNEINMLKSVKTHAKVRSFRLMSTMRLLYFNIYFIMPRTFSRLGTLGTYMSMHNVNRFTSMNN